MSGHGGRGGAGQGPEEHRPASSEEILGVLGSVDAAMVVDIQRTGASALEVLEAFARFQADDAVGPATHRPASPRVAQVIDILEAADTGPEPE